jgi:hypothetical protein
MDVCWKSSFEVTIQALHGYTFYDPPSTHLFTSGHDDSTPPTNSIHSGPTGENSSSSSLQVLKNAVTYRYEYPPHINIMLVKINDLLLLISIWLLLRHKCQL